MNFYGAYSNLESERKKKKKKEYCVFVHNALIEILYNYKILKWKFNVLYNDYSDII